MAASCTTTTKSASAQSCYDSDSDIYGLGSTYYGKKWHRDLSLGLGSQFELGLTFRHDFGKYFAWDVIGIGYAYDYTGASLDERERQRRCLKRKA